MRRSSYFFDIELRQADSLDFEEFRRLKNVANMLASNARLIGRVTTSGAIRFKAVRFSIPMECRNGQPNKVYHASLATLWDEISRRAPRDGSGLFAESSVWVVQDRIARTHSISSTAKVSPN